VYNLEYYWGESIIMTIGDLVIPIVGIFIIGVIALAIYFIPTFIAFVRHKKQIVAILLINIFLGFTIVGWVGALVWAVIREESDGK
jgi:Superinfection immunity protein